MENSRLKVLWFSNYRFSIDPLKATGTWLKVIGERLSQFEYIDFINVTHGHTSSIFYEQVANIKQYVVPYPRFFSNSLPSIKITKEIINIVNKENPQIVHIWGTESYWGLLPFENFSNTVFLLEIQGLLSQIYSQFYGGLSTLDLLKCTGIKELLKFNLHLIFQFKNLKKFVSNEIKIVTSNLNISVQSKWSERVVKLLNPSANIFHSLIPLRDEFLNSKGQWNYTGSNSIFYVSSGPLSYKGLHVLIKAMKIVKEKNKLVKLRIGGNYSVGLRQSGYERFLKKLIYSFDLEENVEWLGPLDSSKIIQELKHSDVFVISSYVESYCVALYEAIAIGIPVICTNSGALPEAEKISSNIIYYQPGDIYILSSFILEKLKKPIQETTYLTDIISADRAIMNQVNIYKHLSVFSGQS